ncbi:sulfatase-like hydrolase/transferase [Aliiglaciecola sp. 3_MG-2023]|uniref:sulfatase-like hydrolase/transferase n=1 Tax=Aliiglaciecola sp. 3_MG-2023 TaxID=3062644 RepID=UPI0026E3A98D|nr:sulfatase-like hydrolase/transferase [Aliiglaciecola sp. 3_MG-2023]MDO6693904.1 sulfatase-like hydrolase/transferase [Aliiglaciecola sp. 3_MG-2023]
MPQKNNMKHTLLILLVTFIITGCSVKGDSPNIVKGDRPNILLIMADDIGIEGFGSYGGTDYKTPHIDKLAAEGIRYTHAYSQPLCTPTRIQIMTGKYNHRNWQYFGILPKGEKTFGHLMSDLGYKTLLAGKWQLTSYDPLDFPNAEKRRGTGTHPRDAGFDEYSLYHSEETEDKGSRYADPTYMRNGELIKEVKGEYGDDITVDYILDFMKRNKEEDMFVYYPLALPHRPMVPTPDSKDWSDPAKRIGIEDPKYFPDMVQYMDKLVGRLVSGLEDLGLRDNTIILFYSDNGTDELITSTMNGKKITGGKAAPTQTGIRVPLIINCPDMIKPSINSDLIDATDFLPTLAELTGGKVPSSWEPDGISFAPGILGKQGEKRDSAFFWYDPRPGWGKDKFERHIFALDHEYKLFSDGRLYSIDGVEMKEKLIKLSEYTEKEIEAKNKLEKVIAKMMSGKKSHAALNEVDGFGNPVKK